MLPTTVANFNAAEPSRLAANIVTYAQSRPAALSDPLCGADLFFAFFYTSIVFHPEETADNLKKYGGVFRASGRARGKRAVHRLYVTRVTVIGALSGLRLPDPRIMVDKYNLQLLAFGGTSLLIVVSVTMDTVAQIKAI